jgi:hypothetical protein
LQPPFFKRFIDSFNTLIKESRFHSKEKKQKHQSFPNSTQQKFVREIRGNGFFDGKLMQFFSILKKEGKSMNVENHIEFSSNFSSTLK